MKNTIYRTVILVAAIFAAGALLQTDAQTVSGSIGNGTFTPGKTTRATVVLSLPGGIHANSNRPGGEYAIPTTVRATATGVKIGAVSYPRGKNRKFDFSDTALNVYEGRVVFSFNVTVPANYRAMAVIVNVTVRYQACTNEVCYAPKSKKIRMTARVT